MGLNKGYFKRSCKKDKLEDGVSRISEMHVLKLKYVLNLELIRFSHRVQCNERKKQHETNTHINKENKHKTNTHINKENNHGVYKSQSINILPNTEN